MTVMKHWHRLPRDEARSSFTEKLGTKILKSWSSFGADSALGSFPLKLFYDSEILLFTLKITRKVKRRINVLFLFKF